MIDRDGDPRRRRFERLYRAHRTKVLAYCGRRTSPDEAQDACAETFLVAWRRFDALPPDDRVLPYLYGVAARVLSNQRRSRRRRTRLGVKLQNVGAGPVLDAASVVVRREQDGAVEAAIRRLAPRDREIVMLYAWEELTRAQIADVVGISKEAVGKRLSRSYRRLGRQLEWLVEPATPLDSPQFAEGGGLQ